ncbi:hypothetical protein V6N11_006692 [Hibiscus sabdariffa]|uniref:Cyclin n=1 Tax=Hibiscus sabdariffa TaxID=183260 RepID=A0ABR2RSC9_9ROSI
MGETKIHYRRHCLPCKASNTRLFLKVSYGNSCNRYRGRVVGTPRILSLLSSLLEKSVQKNETESETVNFKDTVAIFHGLRAPTISIQHYIDRIFKYAGCSPSCFLVAYIYVDRFLQRTDVHLTSLNVHRLLITSVLVAAKFIDDAFFNNAYYARVGGVSTAELNSYKRNTGTFIKSNGQSEPAGLKIVGRAKVIHNVLPQFRDEDTDLVGRLVVSAKSHTSHAKSYAWFLLQATFRPLPKVSNSKAAMT